jgi:hypothetical protein
MENPQPSPTRWGERGFGMNSPTLTIPIPKVLGIGMSGFCPKKITENQPDIILIKWCFGILKFN